MTLSLRRRPGTLRYVLLLQPENYTPLALAYGVTMALFGLILLAVPGLAELPSFSVLAPLRTLWGSLTLAVGLLQVALLAKDEWRRRLSLVSAFAVFVWLWIALAFLLALGHVTTAHAAYVPAAVASAWLSFRTAVRP